MATSFQKTYSVTVTFTRDDGEALTDSDIQASELRAEIKKGIEQASRIQKGIYEAQPGTVSES